MARPLRLPFAHALYLVTSRGWPQAIVKTVADRQAFLDGLAQREISRQHTQAIRPRLSALLLRKHTPMQGLAEAYRTHGYQMREIADHMGLHYFPVSHWIRPVEEEDS